MSYLRNTWYVAACDDEAGVLLAGHLLDKPVVKHSISDASFWSPEPVLLPSDAPAVRARRVLDALIKTDAEAYCS